MQRLSSIIFLLGLSIQLLAQNPHGADFKMDCADCHTSDSWEISQEFWRKNPPSSPNISSTTGQAFPNQRNVFDHNLTEFLLEGQHVQVDCRLCHATLIFREAETSCVSCHTDMHQQTVGMDCARCHDPENWLVDDITQLHYDNGFPLMGSHAVIDCNECHQSASELRFDRLGNECTNCHLDDYASTTNPNHASVGFSTNCIECHTMNGFDWSTENINHDFFPLTQGHQIDDCAQCHTTGDYSSTSSDCFACHQEDYNASANPSHTNQQFPTDCIECHTTDPGWSPAEYLQHDAAYFPIYSGEHNGEWDQCLECHTNPSNYGIFSCTTCHEQNETGNEHQGVGGYSYNSTTCLACHPTGSENDNFNHNLTNFALTGEHTVTDCIECHSAGYTGTPTECASCHTPDFNQATNPNHNELGFSNDCAACHTTEPEWNPATFANHNDYYALNGAHAVVANDCAMCHNGEYINTPNACLGCHQDEYNATGDPDHVAQQFSTDCIICHSENAWEPATLDHNLTNFPLTGEHINTECAQCHTTGYEGTPTACASCHTNDFNQTTNPNHNTLGFSNDCAACHTTEPEWNPATFVNHNDYYALNGAHANIANDCSTCHNGDYNNTANTCLECHLNDYSTATNPNHSDAQFPTDCQSCHTESAWEPSTFDHDGQYFPIYSGRHREAWNQCAECHTVSGNYALFSCIQCHEHSNQADLNDKHSDVQDYTYTDISCFTCHPTGNAD